MFLIYNIKDLSTWCTWSIVTTTFRLEKGFLFLKIFVHAKTIIIIEILVDKNFPNYSDNDCW